MIQNKQKASLKPKNLKALTKKDKRSFAPVSSQTFITTSGYKDNTNAKTKSRNITRRELIGSVSGSVTFSATRYPINPGLATSFPWLSTQAAGYEQYRFNTLKFLYYNRTNTSKNGAFYMAFDYDSQDATPLTEAAIGTYDPCVQAAIWEDAEYGCSKDAMHPFGPRKYIRSSNVAGDPKTYDVGNFFFGTVDCADTSGIGKLWVEYDVDLYVPQTNPTQPLPSRASQYVLNTNQSLTTAVSTVLCSSNLTTLYDPLGLGSPTSGVWTLPIGSYQVDICGYLTDGTNEVFQVSFDFFKNGAAFNPVASSPAHITAYSAGTASGEAIPLRATAIYAMSGTDTMNLQCTCTGAAGAILLRAGFTVIITLI